MKWTLAMAMLLGAGTALGGPHPVEVPAHQWPGAPAAQGWHGGLSSWEVARALQRQGLHASPREVERVLPLFEHAVSLQRERGGQGVSSAVRQDAVEISLGLELDAWTGAPAVTRAIQELAQAGHAPAPRPGPWKPPHHGLREWNDYFDRTAALAQQPRASRLFERYGFHPVKLSWEDHDRDENSSTGSRIADVGVWGRRDARDEDSARLMLTVRRDENFRDRVLMVPADNIRLHRRVGSRMVERTLPQRLRELGLLSSQARFDQNVIVSNQFTLVPVPRRQDVGVDALSFNFSVDPHGSASYVIADTVEGASEVVVAGHGPQLLYFDANGRKAPFTAARASERQQVVAAARELQRAGLDVDVQRFYLVQVPLRHDARGLVPGNMGRPPVEAQQQEDDSLSAFSAPQELSAKSGGPGLEDVVLGHGKAEGRYHVGRGFQGQRADERVRVTVAYFVTPRGELSNRDMKRLAQKFREWDRRSVWGGSFVVPEEQPTLSSSQQW